MVCRSSGRPSCASKKRSLGSPIPTIRWQQGIIVPDGPVHWWEAAVAVCYSSHFVASLTLMGVLWAFDRENGFLPFRRRFSIVTLLGLLGYFLVPSAPPWMAARDGLIEPVRRLSLRGFQVFGGEGAEKAITTGAKFSNQVAAMPSLHGAWSLLIAVFLTRYLPRWSWPILLAYPALMLFSLVSTGEHYVIDVLAGFGCVGVAFALARLIEQRRENPGSH
ncbi:MAG: phosphatase PAP2 family protein [Acidimicrobiales bacterium]